MDKNRDYIRRIMVAVNTIDGVYYLSAKKIGTKANTLALLYALSDGKAHSQKQISEEWLMPKTTINTVVKECIQAGYITLETIAQSREKLICLTDSGKDYANQMLGSTFSAEEQAIEKTLQDFSPECICMLEKFASELHNEFTKLDWED